MLLSSLPPNSNMTLKRKTLMTSSVWFEESTIKPEQCNQPLTRARRDWVTWGLRLMMPKIGLRNSHTGRPRSQRESDLLSSGLKTEFEFVNIFQHRSRSHVREEGLSSVAPEVVVQLLRTVNSKPSAQATRFEVALNVDDKGDPRVKEGHGAHGAGLSC